MKENLEKTAPLEVFMRMVSRLSSTASQLGLFLLSELINEGRENWTVSELAQELSWSRNTVASARDRLIEEELLYQPCLKKWVLAVECSRIDQKGTSSSSSFHDQGDSNAEQAEQLVSRLVGEAEFPESLARTAVLQCPPAAIEKTLENLADWKAYDPHRPEAERVKYWPAYLFKCIERGGLGKLCRAARAVVCGERPVLVEKTLVTKANHRPSRAAVPDTGGSRVKPGAAREEIAAANTARELENARLQAEFEAIWPRLEEAQKLDIVRQVREQLPPFMARQVDFEESPVFQALIRSITVEVHGQRTGLPWRPVVGTKRERLWGRGHAFHTDLRSSAGAELSTAGRAELSTPCSARQAPS